MIRRNILRAACISRTQRLNQQSKTFATILDTHVSLGQQTSSHFLAKRGNGSLTQSNHIPFIKTDIPASRYHDLADETMEHLLTSLEEIVEAPDADESWEVDYSSGVLTLRLGEHGTYVINKQPPNKQIWLSSPTSGPKRFDYTESSPREKPEWFYSRDGKTLKTLMEEELATILGKPVHLDM
ncbi:Mitochondrial chaperone Frataxin [Tulasnella sp. 419]|nr:Mitochondrial chaperone Frataxin [Tulasnella sp. 419]